MLANSSIGHAPLVFLVAFDHYKLCIQTMNNYSFDFITDFEKCSTCGGITSIYKKLHQQMTHHVAPNLLVSPWKVDRQHSGGDQSARVVVEVPPILLPANFVLILVAQGPFLRARSSCSKTTNGLTNARLYCGCTHATRKRAKGLMTKHHQHPEGWTWVGGGTPSCLRPKRILKELVVDAPLILLATRHGLEVGPHPARGAEGQIIVRGDT